VIGVIGDHDPKNPTHLATDAALEDLGVPFEWIATDEVRARWQATIEGLLGMFIAPSTPYRDTEGALEPSAMYGSATCRWLAPEVASSTSCWNMCTTSSV
jgi:hypothetical protein